MKIKFQYTSQIAMLANREEEIIDLPDKSTIQQAFKKLLSNKSEEFKKLIFTNSNSLLQAILLIKNDNQIEYDDATPLENGDTIIIFSPMSGG